MHKNYNDYNSDKNILQKYIYYEITIFTAIKRQNKFNVFNNDIILLFFIII